MKGYMWNFYFLVAVAAGKCQSETNSDDYEFLKAIHDDVQRHKATRVLFKLPSTDHKCYPEIGCFSPASGIVTEHNLYPDPPEKLDTTFRLYTRGNREVAERLDYIDKSTLETPLFNPQVPIVFIIHGMNENGFVAWIIDMKNALLEKKELNIITVDWGKGAPLPYYGQGIVNSELVSRQTARILTSLKKMRGYDIKKTHMIGYSLGAHLSGFTAKFLKGEAETISRITGLDPAGPNFEDKDETFHLSHRDADFVDIVHTSAGNSILTGNVGIRKSIGHIDFYPNGGTDQPGCGFFQLVCSHRRAVLLFTESISNSDCSFQSQGCQSYAEFKEGTCSERRATLGYNSNKDSEKGLFYLFTNGEMPFCKKELQQNL